MENYGSNESKDGKTSSTESSPAKPAKPDLAKAQSLAEMLIHNDAREQQHRVIWEREEKSKEEKDKDKNVDSGSSKPKIPTRPSTETKPKESKDRATVVEAPAESERAADDKLGDLEPEETRAITEQYAAGRSAELRDEQATLPPDSPEQAAAAANASLMRKLAEKLRATPDSNPEQAIAEAADEVIAENNLGTPEQTKPVPVAETVSPDEEDEPDERARHAAHTVMPSPPPSSAGGGTPPPGGPPRYPFPPGYPGGPGGFNPNAPGMPGSPNIYPSATITTLEAQYYARQAENRGLLVGGIVGYLIGRRRGRIKTEKRLLPVQKKLEKQVTNLHNTIASREQQIRTLAAEKARAKQIAEAAPVQQIKPEAATRGSRPTEAITPVEILTPVSPTEHRPQPELVPLATSEARPTDGSSDQRVERMNKQELLKAAQTVVVEGATLRQVYEAHRVTERGLRHIMTEYLRGGDVKKALDQELKIKELTYERDPHLRDSLSADSAPGAGGSTTAQSTAATTSPTLTTPSPAGQATNAPTLQPATPPKPPVAPNNLVQGTLMRVWVVFIIVLVILAAFLLIR